MKNIGKKNIIVTSLIILLILSFSGGTLAYLIWQSSEENSTEIEFAMEQTFSCAADGGGDITEQDAFIAPSDCTSSQYAIMRTVKVKPSVYFDDTIVNLKLFLDVNELGTGLSESENFSYALTTSNTSCTDGVIRTGTFNGKEENDQIKILEKNYTSTTEDTYYLYIWLDAAETSMSTMRQKFDLSLSGKCQEVENETMEFVEPNVPVLDNGMIPVKIANDGSVVTVSPDDPTWYNYEDKRWANVVLVKESGTQSRDYYKENSGVAVSESDILAYYVWIPRYKYRIWTLDATTVTEPQTIDIQFETADAVVSSGTTIGSWKTAPGFIWDGDTLPGIWVGKFETSHSTLSTNKTDNNLACSNEDCTSADGLIIKPNIKTLGYNDISNFFYASRSMSRSSNPFGINALTTDTHMMKNSEWGAVVYLSHSDYGINREVRINNNSGYTTGCGASSEDGAETTECQIKYGESSSYPQSTTGNISGIFDMSGGSFEYVMANYNNKIKNDGFNTLPATKYYDLYLATQFTGDYNTNVNFCTIDTCGGHALSETAGWYSDVIRFVSDGFPWFRRGGYYGNNSDAGSWYFYSVTGNVVGNHSFRSTIVVVGS